MEIINGHITCNNYIFLKMKTDIHEIKSILYARSLEYSDLLVLKIFFSVAQCNFFSSLSFINSSFLAVLYGQIQGRQEMRGVRRAFGFEYGSSFSTQLLSLFSLH